MPGRRGRALVPLLAFALGPLACHVFIDTTSTQCSIDQDCSVMFPGKSLLCVDFSCVHPNAGPAPAPKCKSNKECPPTETGPAICVKATGTCQSIRHEDICVPDLLPRGLAGGRSGNDLLEDDNVIVIGGFAPLTNTFQEPSSRAFNLALKEIDAKGGVPDGPNGRPRPLVMALCGREADRVNAGLEHLVSRLNVPALVPLFSTDILDSLVPQAVGAGAFVLNPNEVTIGLKHAKVQERAWHLLGTPEDLALTYRPLMAWVEKYVRDRKGLAPGDSIRVALVTTKYPSDISIAEIIERGPSVAEQGRDVTRAIAFNGGKSAAENAAETPGYFRREPLESTDLQGTPNYGLVRDNIVGFRPDVIIAVTGPAELEELVPTIEKRLAGGDGSSLPIWVLSTGNARAPGVLKYLGADENEAKHKKLGRFFGVQYAGSPAEAKDWKRRMDDEYLGVDPAKYSATENFYDAIYWLAYGLYASKVNAPPTGDSFKTGVRKLLAGPKIFPGPDAMANAFLAMSTNATTTFIGALGPRDIDSDTGTQFGYGALYCYENASPVTVKYDVRKYDRQSGALVGDETTSCVVGFPPL